MRRSPAVSAPHYFTPSGGGLLTPTDAYAHDLLHATVNTEHYFLSLGLIADFFRAFRTSLAHYDISACQHASPPVCLQAFLPRRFRCSMALVTARQCTILADDDAYIERDRLRKISLRHTLISRRFSPLYFGISRHSFIFNSIIYQLLPAATYRRTSTPRRHIVPLSVTKASHALIFATLQRPDFYKPLRAWSRFKCCYH